MGALLIIGLFALWVALGVFAYGFLHQLFDRREGVDPDEDIGKLAVSITLSPLIWFIGLFVAALISPSSAARFAKRGTSWT